MKDVLGMSVLFDAADTTKLLVRLAISIAFTAVVIRGAYAKHHSSREHVFTYWLFSLVTFSIAFLLRKVPMELGFALGLFAVFGVLRYRTESIAIKDLTYLFVVIGLALVNALANKKVSLGELVVVNLAISGATYLLEWRPHGKPEGTLRILYDRVEWIGPQHRSRLLADVSRRTGLPVQRVTVHSADLLRDTADISLHYLVDEPRGEPSDVEPTLERQLHAN